MIKKLGIGCGGLILLLIVVSVIGGSKTPTTTVIPAGATAATSVAGATVAAATATVAPPAKVGDTVKSGNWSYTVTKVEKVKSLIWSDFGNKTDAIGVFVVVSITLRNIGDRNFPINTTDFQVTDTGGIKYDTSSASGVFSYASYRKLTPLGSQFPPGVDVQSVIVFDVNPAATGLKLVLKQANGTTIALE